jgi:hypothetical protein
VCYFIKTFLLAKAFLLSSQKNSTGLPLNSICLVAIFLQFFKFHAVICQYFGANQTL